MNQSVRGHIDGFFAAYEQKTYQKGEIITFAGEEPAGVSLLLEGVVEQYDITPEGNRITVNMYKPGAFFPMSWAINKTPNGYFYAALTTVRLRQAGSEETVAFLQANPDVLFDLLSRVYRGTDALLRRLVLAASGIAASRLIFELLIEAYRFGTETNDSTVVVNVRQQALAARSGLARETVSRELHKLQADKLLTLTNKGIVLDLLGLEKRLDISV